MSVLSLLHVLVACCHWSPSPASMKLLFTKTYTALHHHDSLLSVVPLVLVFILVCSLNNRIPHSVWLCSRFSVVSLGGLYSLPRLQTTTLWTTPKCTSLVLPLLSNLSSFSAQLRYHTGASDFACAQENLTRPLNSSPNPHFLTCPCSFIPYLCLDHEDLSNQPSFKPQNHLWFSLPLLPHME